MDPDIDLYQCFVYILIEYYLKKELWACESTIQEFLDMNLVFKIPTGIHFIHILKASSGCLPQGRRPDSDSWQNDQDQLNECSFVKNQ